MSSMDSLYVACKNNDICRVRELLQILTEDELNEQDPNNRTALHVAALHGHGEVLELLLAHENINQSIKNQWGYVAKDEAPAHLKFLFDKMPTINNNTDTMNEYNNCVEESIEWFDTYKLAYRIAYENHIHLKRWLTKVSFARLVGEIDTGYIDKIDFGSDQIDQKILIKDYMKQAMEKNDPTPLVRAYTEKTRFVTKLNEDLANGGSDFRQLYFRLRRISFNTTRHGQQEAVKCFDPATNCSIINITSVVSGAPAAQLSVYSASKAAVDAMTKALAKELGPRKIRVNSIRPGTTITEGTHAAGLIGSSFETQIIAQTPLGRLGQPDDIARVAVFFASDDSQWITGECVTVAGGSVN
ncbi:unnamed protein product [Rotaria sp. Silwood1]|nr:unnamed protein product [Rotaria sp. Silwood1]CAF4885101.1 unnamed protein product [Rotaria sp. Silwood1]CAF4927061.1 unnamed protein product [Rotaria sp. Silwood1]